MISIAEEPLSAKLRANHRLEIRSLAVCIQKARKRLQCEERLLLGAQ
jgi:hypothetical protein